MLSLRKVRSSVQIERGLKFEGVIFIANDEPFDASKVSGAMVNLYEQDGVPYTLTFWYSSRIEYLEPGYETPDMYTHGRTTKMAAFALSLSDAVEESMMLDSFVLPEDQQWDGGEYYSNNTFFDKQYLGSLAISRTESHPDLFLHFVGYNMHEQYESKPPEEPVG